jgi:protein-disulfide isomerase
MELIIKSLFLTFILAFQVQAEGMTKEQGDAILKELKSIRQELQQLRKQGGSQAARPSPQRASTAKVTTLGNPVLGDVNAPITLVEFTDYQCPFCKRFYTNTFLQLKKEYIDTGKLRLVLRDLPLDFHNEAKLAARAVHCAGEQDMLWQMHDALFESKNGLKEEQLLSTAKEIGLDQKVLQSCLNSIRYNKNIEQDIADAGKASITGTPSFVIGMTTDNIVDGVIIRGAQPYTNFKTIIDKQLKEQEQ